MSRTGCFLLFLSAGVMSRPYVQVIKSSCALCSPCVIMRPVCLSFPGQFELRTAIELGKKIVLVHGE